MERFLIDRCDFCMHRNGMLCDISHRDCKPGLEPCPYEGEMVPCKYEANDNVRRYLESLGVKVEIRNQTPDEGRVKEAHELLEDCIKEDYSLRQPTSAKPNILLKIKNFFKKR